MKHLEIPKVLVVAINPLLLVYQSEDLVFDALSISNKPSPDKAWLRKEEARGTAENSEDHNWQMNDAYDH